MLGPNKPATFKDAVRLYLDSQQQLGKALVKIDGLEEEIRFLRRQKEREI